MDRRHIDRRTRRSSTQWPNPSQDLNSRLPRLPLASPELLNTYTPSNTWIYLRTMNLSNGQATPEQRLNVDAHQQCQFTVVGISQKKGISFSHHFYLTKNLTWHYPTPPPYDPAWLTQTDTRDRPSERQTTGRPWLQKAGNPKVWRFGSRNCRGLDKFWDLQMFQNLDEPTVLRYLDLLRWSKSEKFWDLDVPTDN